MLQTKGIITTSRELDFPCFLQNKYLFARKEAGRMRHVPLTLKACVCAGCSTDMIVYRVPSKDRLSYIAITFEAISSAAYTKQRKKGLGSSGGICNKWKAKWAVELLLGAAPCTAPSRQEHHFPSSRCGEHTTDLWAAYLLVVCWNELQRFQSNSTCT